VYILQRTRARSLSLEEHMPSAVTVHTWAAGIWLVLAVLTTAWAIVTPDNPYLLAWIVFMSGYANVGAHLAGRAGAGPSEGESPS
jgi:hypothetical protein